MNNDMNRQHSKGKPDFFAVLVLLVMVGVGLSVTLQLVSSDVERMVDRESVARVVPG